MLLSKIFRNTAFGLISQMVLLIFGFISQRVMNLYMGAELVGMNGVISNIIAVISVTELGLSTAIAYHLYEALAEEDHPKVAALMRFYRNAYFLIGAAVAVLGLVLVPWLPLFLKHSSYTTQYVRVLYLLWLLRSVLPYYLTYKRTLLLADQRGYRLSLATIATNIANYTIITVVVSRTRNYLCALVLNIVVDVAIDLLVNADIDRRYPYLKYPERNAAKKLLPLLKKDLKNVFVSTLSNNLLLCTDSVIISSFVSVAVVGFYNNYNLITRAVSNILTEVATAVQPSVCYLMVKEDHESDYRVLRQLTFAFFCVTAIAGCGLCALIDPFVVDLWLDGTFQMQRTDVLLCIVVTLLQGMGLPLSIVMSGSGLFQQEKNLSALTAVVNMVVSLVLVVPLGITGVLWGTILSYLIQIVYRCVVFFTQYAHRRCKRYLADFSEYALLIPAEIWLTGILCKRVYRGTVLTFLVSGILCICLPTVLNLLLYSRSWRLQCILRAGKALLHGGSRKREE